MNTERHGHGHMNICNIQDIERSTDVVSMSDIDTDACRTLDITREWGVRVS